MRQRIRLHCIIVCLFLVLDQGNSYASADKDGDKCIKLKTLDYELYGTKTLYDDARRYLERKDEIPNSFDDDSLEEEHNDLLQKSCKPVVFYFFGRHSARFPDGDDAVQYNKHMAEIQNMLRQHYNETNCPEKYAEFLNWKPKLQFDFDNLITHLGGIEQREIARRFKKLYPEFFNTNKTDIKIGVTTEIRTSQTAVEFLKEVDGLKLEGCEESLLQTHDVDDPNHDPNKLRSHDCYKKMQDNYKRPYLEFHDDCKNRMKGKVTKQKYPLVDRVRDPKVVQEIIESISKKIGFESAEKSPINVDVLNSIYDNCRFENAFLNDSVWCKLFSKKHLKAMEYIEDVNTYYKGGYGVDARVKQSCPLVKDLVEEFIVATKETSHMDQTRRKSIFYFSHATPMKKLLATFGMFKDDESFSESAIAELERSLKAPKRRNWRISLISPFSGNIAFILYRCQKPGKEDVKFKILSAVTEHPVKLGGCGDTDCSSEKFFKTYEPLRTCDLDKICG